MTRIDRWRSVSQSNGSCSRPHAWRGLGTGRSAARRLAEVLSALTRRRHREHEALTVAARDFLRVSRNVARGSAHSAPQRVERLEARGRARGQHTRDQTDRDGNPDRERDIEWRDPRRHRR